MEQSNQIKIKSYLNIAKKAGYVIFGGDNLKNYKQKMFLILLREDAGNSLVHVAKFLQEKTKAVLTVLKTEDYNAILNCENCKLCGIKNKGISDQIIKLLEV